MLGLLARRLSAVIVVCDEQRGGWINYGTPRERVVVIANGVSASEARDARAEVRRELGIRDQAVVAVIVASLRPVKRVPDFVRAVLKARERVTELVGVIAGDGPGRAEVLRAAAGDMAIRFLGHRDDIPRLLQGADLLVLTSAHEALPMAVLEGMAAGLPVLATKVGGIQTLVRDGETGLLVPPADTRSLADGLVRLSRDAALRTKMGRAGRRYSLENWSAKKMIDSYAAVLHAIAATGR
jgi:glycosyltransferase involved in cell wall biosynthesis